MKAEEFMDAKPGDRFKIELEVDRGGGAKIVGGRQWYALGERAQTLRGAEVLDLVRAPPPPVRETWVLEDVPLPCTVQTGDMLTSREGGVYAAQGMYWCGLHDGVTRVQRRVKP